MVLRTSESWWRRVRPRLTPLTRGEPLGLDALEASLRERVARYVAPDRSEARVSLPPPLREHLAQVGGTTWLGQRIHLDLLLYSAVEILGAFEGSLETFGDEEDVGVREAGVWLEFAHRGDKVAWFVCVDPTRAEYGLVGEGYDEHPWLNGAGALRPLKTLEDWQEDLLNVSSRPRSPALFALSPDELTALRAEIAEGDVTTAVRALADLRTPDSAWGRTLEARERVVLVRTSGRVGSAIERAGAEALRDDEALRAWTLDAADAFALSDALPEVPAWDVLAWDTASRSMRAVQAATEALRAFVLRANEAGHALLWVTEEGGDEGPSEAP